MFKKLSRFSGRRLGAEKHLPRSLVMRSLLLPMRYDDTIRIFFVK
jgi:hypothetical protein